MYEWLKAFHVIAIIAWMAGMLYLPRLFVYHCDAEPGSRQSETFKVMERRLLTAIMTPAMVVSWVLGLWLAWDGNWHASGWLQAKVALVLMLSGLHGFFLGCARDFAADRNRHSKHPDRQDDRAILGASLDVARMCPAAPQSEGCRRASCAREGACGRRKSLRQSS